MEKGQGKGTDTLQTDNVFTRKEYIERESFIENQRHLYCENCERRKGMKNGKMKFVYNIGDVPCRACDIGDMLNSLEDYVPAADAIEVVRCRECKYSAVDFEDLRYCKLVTYYNHVPDDWFCGDGERKDGDGDV